MSRAVGRAPRATVFRVGLIALAVAAGIGLSVTGNVPSTDEVREVGDDLGAWGPFVWPPLFAVFNLLVPWPLLAGATGLVFGTAAGTPLALAGVLLAASLQFVLARFASGEDLRRRVLARVPRFDRILERNGLLAIFLSRITPGVPWGAVNYAAGFSKARLRDLWLATVAGGTPKVFAYVALGGSFDDLSRPEAIVAISVWVLVAIVGLAVARRRPLSE